MEEEIKTLLKTAYEKGEAGTEKRSDTGEPKTLGGIFYKLVKDYLKYSISVMYLGFSLLSSREHKEPIKGIFRRSKKKSQRRKMEKNKRRKERKRLAKAKLQEASMQ